MNKLIQAFQRICGAYSLCALKADDIGNWSATLYRGGKRLGIISSSPFADELAVKVSLETLTQDEGDLLTAWADKAGPLGFETPEEFVDYMYHMTVKLREWRSTAKRGHLVVCAKDGYDDHELPHRVKSSDSNRVTGGWIAEYKKKYPNMNVLNEELA